MLSPVNLSQSRLLDSPAKGKAKQPPKPRFGFTQTMPQPMAAAYFPQPYAALTPMQAPSANDTFSNTLSPGPVNLTEARPPAGKPAPAHTAMVRSMSGQQILYPVQPVLNYIQAQWRNLLVTNQQLPEVMKDPKVHQPPGTPSILYISAKENPMRVWQDLQKSLSPQALKGIQIRTLPPPGARNNLPPGLLYVPHPYVVPGGRFKEMYGWDSYFIQLGLLKDGHLGTAKGMTDNLLYEIENYGTILNANRSYFINRSQPPFITEMVLNVFNRTGDKAWLNKAMPAVENHYGYWTSGGHLITSGPAAGLSRYFAYGEGPALEVLQGEVENGKNHYQRIKEYFQTTPIPDYDVNDYYDARTGQLKPQFYKGDRTMRESGFDPSNRFGPFNIDVVNYAPVCLNSLLYRMEKDMSQMYQTLGNPAKAAQMDTLAQARKERMNRVLWNDNAGMYQDYNIKTNQRRFYPYATMFFPLWAGAASPQQAARTIQNLPWLESPGGLMTSATQSGNQWDAPFAWAPLQLVAVQGMLNYNVPGAKESAVRISNKFINQVAKEFSEHGGIFEKYDARRMESDVADGIDYGYDSNELGFGWTNGVFLELLDVVKNAQKPQHPLPPASPAMTPSFTMPSQPAVNPFYANYNRNPFLQTAPYIPVAS
ncbi:MAG: Alpha,alpha-trehalase [Vampirovibrio sp.]|nr:Alpha,alpha-trehalase [Vampirovibrio sp.]